SVATNEDVCTASAGAACGEPPVIDFGEVASGNKAEYEENDSVQYTCNPGYTLSGSEWVTCRERVWTPAAPQCLGMICSPPRIPNGNFRPQEVSYMEGATITIYCNSGYHFKVVSGQNTAQCTKAGWVPSPECVRKSEKCGPPPVIESGDLLSFPQQEYASGATVEYKCPSLYVLKGSPTITCVGGQWTTPPVCLVACTASEEDMDRNNIELRETTKKKLYLKSGDFAEFKCKVGYKQDPASSPFRVQCVEGTLVYPHCKAKRHSRAGRPLKTAPSRHKNIPS
uniref:Complement factor H-related protein 1-like n=1 Tax=Nothoprocta perdicaria TaxID=30464 RepID=A0A8C6YWN0_NOTPE